MTTVYKKLIHNVKENIINQLLWYNTLNPARDLNIKSCDPIGDLDIPYVNIKKLTSDGLLTDEYNEPIWFTEWPIETLINVLEQIEKEEL